MRGAYHEEDGSCCQDSARVYVRDGLAVAAVSDGHGSEKHFRSASGSEMAARIAIRSMTDFCERDGSLAAIFADDPGEAARRIAASFAPFTEPTARCSKSWRSFWTNIPFLKAPMFSLTHFTALCRRNCVLYAECCAARTICM